jgi:hypothetical protein
MNLFDLLFILLFLATMGALLVAIVRALRGQTTRALSLLRKWAVCAGAYFAIVAISSLFWPRTVLRLGEPRCFDDWCIAVENIARQPADGGADLLVKLRLSSAAKRISQREQDLAVYIADDGGHRYEAAARASDIAFNVQLGPQESVTTTRAFYLPATARNPVLVIAHEGGFQMGWLIIGYETWFHKPTMVRIL